MPFDVQNAICRLEWWLARPFVLPQNPAWISVKPTRTPTAQTGVGSPAEACRKLTPGSPARPGSEWRMPLRSPHCPCETHPVFARTPFAGETHLIGECAAERRPTFVG